jgi:hypothetical protein
MGGPREERGPLLLYGGRVVGRQRREDARFSPLDACARARARFPVVNDNRPVVL